MWKASRLLALALCACIGEIDDFGDDTAPGPGPIVEPDPIPGLPGADGGVVGMTVTLEIPAEIARDHLTGEGTWVARTTFRATPSQPVAAIEWNAGRVVGVGMPPDYAFTVDLHEDGERVVEAIARGQGGVEVGRATAPLRVMPPTSLETCLSKLDALGVDYSVGPSSPGVARPVTVTLPLNGISYKSSSGTVRRTHFMDCELALALWRSAELWRARGVKAVTDYGIYNYRCIDQSIRPPCTGTAFSQHAFAMAIDLATFERDDGTRLSVNDDWVIDSGHACAGTVAGAKNDLLHQLACALYTNRVFKIILTPNYNAAHRNHFHVDLTSRDSSSIYKTGEHALDLGPYDE
jgi:hypothetical protein